LKKKHPRGTTSTSEQRAAARRTKSNATREIEQYEHPAKTRLNNPPVGLVTRETDPDQPKKKYLFDPHLDPQLVWAGKVEKDSLELDTVSLHVHERIDPFTIVESITSKNGRPVQPSLFERPTENPPLRLALDFYRHQHEWSNRLIAGDSALVMNSLLEREGLTGQVQMVYLDPPYGIKYASNFQPFVNRRDVKDGLDGDLTQEPEMVRAFRDTWELGIHSYLSYLRDRLLLARELLSESGSCFIQISDANLHLVHDLASEVFGESNLCGLIAFVKTTGLGTKLLPGQLDYLIWFAKKRDKVRYYQLFAEKVRGEAGATQYDWVHKRSGEKRRVRPGESIDSGDRLFHIGDMSAMLSTQSCVYPVGIEGRAINPPANRQWQTNAAGMQSLIKAGRVILVGNSLRYVRYLDDFPVTPLSNLWNDTGISGFGDLKVYVVQTSTKVVQRCVLMTTEPGDLVFDPTCGSGTTAVVAEEWGRRWITCDTSRVSIAIAKQRLMTTVFEYYELAHLDEGVDSGFRYKTVPHVTLRSIANNDPPDQEILCDQPLVDRRKSRITGPFTVEAVPSPIVTSYGPVGSEEPDGTIGRSGPTIREADFREQLLRTGVRGLGGKVIKFSRVEPSLGTVFVHAQAETIEDAPQRVAISFGPDYAPLEQRQVEGAWKEAQMLNPAPVILLFAAFQFDPEAAKDIDEMNPRLAKMTFLKVQMNTDLLTGDLKKKRATNESFWLVGRPDVELRKVTTGEHEGKYLVEVHGFDYYDVKTGEIVSGNASKIAMWMLDTDYDERSLFPRQVFFPMAGEQDGWSKLAKNLKAEIDESLIEAYRGAVSLPFEAGKHKRIAVKIIDDRGVESLRVLNLP
jgi:adenine-specific DNA-methyltransferase